MSLCYIQCIDELLAIILDHRDLMTSHLNLRYFFLL